jgi:DHA2 family methylenomycin A resistance protein-like MFS transporter
MIQASSAGWFSPLVLLGFGVSVICGVAFVLVEGRIQTPMLPLDFFQNSAFSAAMLVGLAINLTLYGGIFILSLYFQRVHHFSPLEFGVAFLPLPLGLLVTNLGASWLSEKLGSRLPMVLGLLLAAVGYWLLHGLDVRTPYVAMLPGLIILPLGIGLAVPTMTTTLLSTVPRSRSGIASGVLNTVRQAGGALGVALFGSFLAQWAIHGVQLAFISSAGMVVVAAIVAVLGVHPPKQASLASSKKAAQPEEAPQATGSVSKRH